VAPIYNIVRTLAKREQVGNKISENSPCIFVGSIAGKSCQIMLHLQQKFYHPLLVLALLIPFQAFAEQIEIGQKIDGSAFGYRSDLHFAIAEDSREQPLSGAQQRTQQVGKITRGNGEVAGLGGAVNRARQLWKQRILLTLLRP